jgi:hypothetical protein
VSKGDTRTRTTAQEVQPTRDVQIRHSLRCRDGPPGRRGTSKWTKAGLRGALMAKRKLYRPRFASCITTNRCWRSLLTQYTVLRTWAEQTFRLQSRNNVDAGRGSRQPSAQRFCPCLPPACQILPRQPAFRGIDVRVLWALEMDPSIRTQQEASCHNKSAYLRTWPSGQARSLFDSSAGCCPCLSRERAWDVPVFDWEHRAAWSSPQKA